jgi:hypothetical protein
VGHVAILRERAVEQRPGLGVVFDDEHTHAVSLARRR